MSFTKGVSFHHETNATSQPTINNHISITASNDVSANASTPYLDTSGEVKYEPVTRDVAIDADSSYNMLEFLKKVVKIYMRQKVYFSGKYIVLSVDELHDLITTLCPVDITIDYEPINISCCGSSLPYSKVSAIWIADGIGKANFKYTHSQVYSVFDEYKISTKFVQAVD